MPPSRSDRRLLLVTGGCLVAAAVLVAIALFFATGGGANRPKPAPVYLGLAKDRRERIETGGPDYIANPFGRNGIWLDLEHGHLVALDVVVPGTKDCTVKWKGREHSYVDCHGDRLTTEALDRFELTIPKAGATKGGLYVDLRVRIPAPARAQASVRP